MRIPSQYNEDSLYRRGRGRDESAKNQRRLVRLVIALALVVVVMNQASKPAIYQTFFAPQESAPGHWKTSPSRSATAIDPNQPAPANPTPIAPEAPIAPEDRAVAHLLTQELLPTDQREWVVGLSRWQSGRPVDAIPSTIETILDRLATVQNASDEQRMAWQAMLESFMKTTIVGNQASTPTTADRPRVAAFLAALDDAAASRVVDGSVWRSGDFDSFYRYLDQAGGLSETGIAATGVLPLLQQPDVFRNQLVRVHGGVARAERIDARENPYGITEYWQLWLRPSDGADRPLVAIVAAVSAPVESVGRQGITDLSPQVTIVGTFLKRLAYESAMGADLAPVVVGRIVVAPVSENEVVHRVEQGDDFQRRLWMTATLASLIGFTLAAVTIWRTSAMSKRARELRSAHRKEPDEFLNSLGKSTNHVAASNEVQG
jgi:hypothetical protein